MKKTTFDGFKNLFGIEYSTLFFICLPLYKIKISFIISSNSIN